MVIDSLAFECLYFSLKLPSLLVVIVFLSIRPLLDAPRFLLIVSETIFLCLFVLVDLSVLHFEFGNIVSCFVFVSLQVELNDWTVSDRQSFSLLHFLKASLWFSLSLGSKGLLGLTLWPFWSLCEDVSCSEV